MFITQSIECVCVELLEIDDFCYEEVIANCLSSSYDAILMY